MAIYELDGIMPEISGEAGFIADNAVVIGNVRLARHVGIWFGAVLRGDNELIEIGENSNIQDNCVCHTDPGFPLTVGANCTIGHNVILHGCTIGDGTLVGMGAIIMNGAKIGPNSVIGAGAIVTEGKEFAANSLILGAPARLARTLDAAQAEALAGRGAAHYVRNGARFKAGLRKVR